MALLRTLLGRRELDVRASIESPQVPISSSTILEFIGGHSRSSAGVRVTEQSSLGMPAVWRAVNLIAHTCAGLPLHAYREAAGAPVRATSTLLDDPHPDLTGFELWELVFVHLCLWGNAYLQKLRNGAGTVQELWPIHPSRMQVTRDDQMRKRYIIDGDLENPRDDDRILHIPGFGYDGITGVSPIRAARNAVGLGLAAEDYGGRLFANGSLASGILQTEQRLEKTQADALKQRWKDRAQGLDNAHDVVVLDAGAKFEQLTIPPEDAQFIESRRFQIAEVARMFGIPPWMLADVERSTSWGTGIEQQMIAAVVFTFRPWLIRVEQRITKHLLPRPQYARYTVEGLLRGDSAQRAAFYTAMWNIGVLSTNDILALEERPGIGPDGDVRYRPLNMGVLGQPDPEPAPAPAPATEGASVDA